MPEYNMQKMNLMRDVALLATSRECQLSLVKYPNTMLWSDLSLNTQLHPETLDGLFSARLWDHDWDNLMFGKYGDNSNQERDSRNYQQRLEDSREFAGDPSTWSSITSSETNSQAVQYIITKVATILDPCGVTAWDMFFEMFPTWAGPLRDLAPTIANMLK